MFSLNSNLYNQLFHNIRDYEMPWNKKVDDNLKKIDKFYNNFIPFKIVDYDLILHNIENDIPLPRETMSKNAFKKLNKNKYIYLIWYNMLYFSNNYNRDFI